MTTADLFAKQFFAPWFIYRIAIFFLEKREVISKTSISNNILYGLFV